MIIKIYSKEYNYVAEPKTIRRKKSWIFSRFPFLILKADKQVGNQKDEQP